MTVADAREQCGASMLVIGGHHFKEHVEQVSNNYIYYFTIFQVPREGLVMATSSNPYIPSKRQILQVWQRPRLSD